MSCIRLICFPPAQTKVDSLRLLEGLLHTAYLPAFGALRAKFAQAEPGPRIPRHPAANIRKSTVTLSKGE